jgi:hypothetical protein
MPFDNAATASEAVLCHVPILAQRSLFDLGHWILSSEAVQIERLIRPLLEERARNHAIPVDKLFYHYTDARSLHNIIRTHELWASHVGHMSDTSELKYAADLVCRVLDQHALRLPAESRPRSVLSGASAERAEIREHGYFSRGDLFVASFCESGDLLSQWRGYTKQGTGYAIGFTFDLPFTRLLTSPVILRKILYTEVDQIRLVSETARAVVECIESLTPNDAVLPTYSGLLMGFLLELVLSFKDPCFAEEKEWRIIQQIPHMPLPSEALADVRDTEHYLIPYQPLRLWSETTDHLSIKRVVVGPSLSFDVAARGVQTALHKYGYRFVPVEHSKVPLR